MDISLKNDKKSNLIFQARKAFLASFTSALIIFVLAILLFIQIRDREFTSLRELVTQNTTLISDAVQTSFTTEVGAIKRMADRWEASNGTPQNVWRADAKNYVQDISGLEVLARLTPAHETAWYELQPNASLTPLIDFYSSAEMRERLTQASHDKGHITVFTLSCKTLPSARLIALIPIYNSAQFDGFILGGFDSEKLLANSVSPLAKKYYVTTLGASPPPSLAALSGSEDIRIKNVTLQLRVWPTQDLLNARHSSLSAFVLAAGSLLALVVGIIVYFIQRTIWQAVKLRQQSQSLQESETSFQILVDGVVDYAIYMLDPKGYVKTWNAGAQRIKQYETEEILGQHFSRFYTPEECAKGEPAKALAIAASTGIYVAEDLRVRKNGERFWASVVINALRNRQGELIGFAKITRDITSIKVAEKERDELIHKLMDSNSELERFAFIASHDLQEPLRLVCNFSALLKKDFAHELNEEARQYISIIDESAHRMNTLILDLLEYARMGSQSGREEVIDVTQCITYVTNMLQIVIQNSKATITYDTFPPIRGNPVHFSTLLQNLIGNALKYQTKGAHPVIHIGMIDKTKEWLFCVKDNGIGMKPEYLQQIFDPFKRLHNKDEYFGTGMGLAICRKIVSEMGGVIWAESSPGAGSIFYFTIAK